MKAIFVEMSWFTNRLTGRLDDVEYRDFQQKLIVNPDIGDVMPGCGGLRKARWVQGGRGKGKRSGVRIIYLAIPEASLIYLVDIYGKDEKDDLSAHEKSELVAIVKELKKRAIATFRQSRGVK
jgi:mRNA-degrading endonuclease RelE of RelBE toxin-antitoxin system